MNLYEILTRKVYLSSNQSQRRRENTLSSADDDPGDEEDGNEVRQSLKGDKLPRRKSSNRKSQSQFGRPSYFTSSRQVDDDPYDLLDSSKSYRRYRLLSAANSEQARTEARAYFETIVSQVDRIKLALVCFVCFHMVSVQLTDC